MITYSVPKVIVTGQKESRVNNVYGYPLFNDCEHTLVDLSHLRTEGEDWMYTFSVKLPNGNFATMCVMQPSDEQSCIDVKFHGENIDKHKVIGFVNGRSQSIANQGIYALVLDAKEVK